jgi:tellurite methyltransferase
MDDDRHRWNRRHAAAEPSLPPARFLTDRAGLLPRVGRALDVAGGTGRNAVWLARRGLDVTLVDVSDEACRLALARAAAAGVAVTVVRRDLTVDALPAGPWELVLVHHYLDRTLLHAVWRTIASAGLLLVAQPTVRNLERHPRPARRWLLDEGELARLAAELPAAELVELREGWTEEGRHEAQLVARRRVPTGSTSGRQGAG